MNNDLISRSELKKTLCEDYEAREHYIGQMMLKAIDNAPAVQAYPFEQVLELVKLNQQFAQEIEHLKRPQGEWIKVKEERMSVDMSGEIVTRYKCSKCGRVIATFPSKLAGYYPFCHCGAKMLEGGAE